MVAEVFPDIIGIDDKEYHVRFDGFDLPLHVLTRDGNCMTILPWCFKDHCNALEKAYFFTSTGSGLDLTIFCESIFNRCCVPEKYHNELRDLTLWWVSGIDGSEPVQIENKTGTETETKVHLGPVSVNLVPWHSRNKESSLRRWITTEDATFTFKIIKYLEDMINSTISSFDREIDITELDARAINRLVAAVIEINLPYHIINTDDAFNRKLAVNTLKVCSALGWTPSQVWNTPAREIDHILQLLQITSRIKFSSTPSVQSGSRLSAFNDSVVFSFQDD